MKQLLIIAIAFTTLQTIAQEDKKHKRHERTEIMKELTPNERATINTKRMTLELDLNESQKTQVQEIMLKNAIEQQEKMKARKDKKGDEKNKPSKEDYVKHVNERLDRQIEMKSKMKAILTAEQYKKWESSLSKRHKKGKQKRKEKARH